MAYVAPNSRAIFYKNTGLSPNYDNTLYFSSNSAKDDYFGSLGGFDTSRLSYQRENRNTIRVETNIINLYNCDYMRFKNDSFENKWFYAFVTAVNYVNNITTEVVYQLDPLMTWMGVFTLNQCYVARQHTRNDGIGNNICAENLPTGEYITESCHALATYQPSIMRARIAVAKGDAVQTRGGIMSGTVCYDCSSSEEVYSRLQDLVDSGEADSIISITMIPQAYTQAAVYSSSYSYPKPYSSLNGYVPRNKKLFCYPYKYMTIDTDEGDTANYSYEYFNTVPDATSSGNYSFTVAGCGYATGCEVMIQPNNYKANSNVEYRLNITHFPQCAFSTDAYQAYLAQKNAKVGQLLALNEKNATSPVQLAGSVINSSIPSLGSIISNPVGAALQTFASPITSVAGSIVNGAVEEDKIVNENMVENTMPIEQGSRYRGTASADIMYSTGRKGFWIYEKCITKNYAMMLDDYFDCYGYAIKQHITPNMNARPHWTYVKTIGCSISGALPASDKKDIENLFDKGLRFWHSLSEMGNYSLDNSPS